MNFCRLTKEIPDAGDFVAQVDHKHVNQLMHRQIQIKTKICEDVGGQFCRSWIKLLFSSPVVDEKPCKSADFSRQIQMIPRPFATTNGSKQF